jgi:hypothetical protein
MHLSRRIVDIGAALGLLLTVWVLQPAHAHGQDEDVDRALLTRYALAHVELNDARDEFHGKVGRVHDEEGRRRAREELDARVDSIFVAHEMTLEEYDEITLTISLDGAVRTMFEEILLEIAEGEGGDSAGDAVVVVDRAETLE